MPNYEYRCTNCENQFEIWQEVGAEAPPCPECQSEVKKVFHPIRTIYKGSGFYITDTRAEKGAAAAGSSSSGSTTSSDGESKSVPATPAPAKSDSAAGAVSSPSTPAAPKAA